MNIKVTTTKVEIDNESLNKGEYNIRECNFELAEEFIGLVCKALFTTSKTKLTYEQSIVNGKCNIPYEATLNRGKVIIGVIGYEIEDEELIKRYSPEPDEFFVLDGSYVEDIENQSIPTPTEIEQLEQRVSAIEIDAGQVEINTQDIADIKNELTGFISDTDYANSNKGGVFKTSSSYNTAISNGALYALNNDYATYQGKGNGAIISKGTLENVITGKNLETATNKVTSLSSSSTDTEYPTAKCVYDYINSQINDAIGGAY